MLNFWPTTRVFAALESIDGRKGVNGLYTLVKETLVANNTRFLILPWVRVPGLGTPTSCVAGLDWGGELGQECVRHNPVEA